MIDPTNIIPIGTTREWHGMMIAMTEDGWRAEVKHNMHRRCKNWDYCQPWIYMITIDTQHHALPPVPVLPAQGDVLSAPGCENIPNARCCEVMSSPSLTESKISYRLPSWLEQEYSKNGHPHLFGELSPELGPDGKPFIQLNAFGKAVEKEILGIPHYYPQLRILEYIVMPNHIHFVVRVMERLPEKKPLGFIINKFKSGVNALYKEILLGLPKETPMHIEQQREHPDQSNYGKVKSSPSETERTRLNATGKLNRGHGSSNPDTGLVFESGFHDRILFREGQLDAMRAYVLDNPRRLWELVHNREYFEHIENWAITMPLLPYGGTKNAGRWWEYYPSSLASACSVTPVSNSSVSPVSNSSVTPVSNSSVPPVSDGRLSSSVSTQSPSGLLGPLSVTADTMTVTFSAIGNRSLLQVPERMQIQCSRKMQKPDIEELMEEVLEASKHGVIPVSPCLSPGEKTVARAVMDAGYPLVALFPQGIPPQTEEYKPYGQFFDACARGQLLILSPWEFKPGVQKVARWQCLMLNDMAAQLSVTQQK